MSGPATLFRRALVDPVLEWCEMAGTLQYHTLRQVSHHNALGYKNHQLDQKMNHLRVLFQRNDIGDCDHRELRETTTPDPLECPAPDQPSHILCNPAKR